jgi:transcriptional regulator with XRE-family HTH domain
MAHMGKYDPAPTLAAGLVRTARQKAGLTQSALAESAGMQQQAISAYETGRLDPTLPTLQRILAAAGYELRLRLEPIDDHDQSLDEMMKRLPPGIQDDVARASKERADAARLRRIRGN